jgi:hypothetical protein
MPTDYTNYNSNVDTVGLNENFPTPGINNPSQGLRDNFAKIKSTFGQVSVELTQLRNYVLRKLDEGEIFDHDNDVKYNKLYRAQLQSYSETFYDIGQADTVVNVNFLNGNFQKVTLTKTADLSLGGFPSSHNAVGRLTLWITCNNVAHRISLPPEMIYGTTVSYVVGGQLRFPSEGNYLIELVSVNYAAQYWLVAVHGLNMGGGGTPTTYELPTASVSTLGGVKVDGITIGINNGVIRVIGGSGGGGFAVGATGAVGPQGPAGQDTIYRSGGTYSYMYGGTRLAGNESPRHLVTVTGISSNGIYEFTLAHHHSGSGQHGAYSRIAYATNASTGMVELEKYEKYFDAGVPTGNIGFVLTRPVSGNIEIRWLGNVSFGSSFSFYMTINSNTPVAIHNIGLD